ncbi:MAG: ShlB/FhaC/HecB family hemolysin secretion/activation protein [Campylobacteraceae bacterium]|jgi:hemolysin activation/secretion protein|nr:ShlB/FhaC/HecB family hemolysin secretion/activation protein [Campylobacteraceae bacterium]
MFDFYDTKSTKCFFGKKTAVFLLSAGCIFGYDADGIDSAKPPVEPQTKAQELTIIQNEEKFALDGGGKIYIKDFEIEGTLEGESLEEITASYKNKELGMRGINELNAKIIQYYKSRGYPMANALVPKQNIQNDILKIIVIIGRYGAVSYVNESPVRDFVIQNTLERTLKKGGYITSSLLERAMLLTGDMSGAALPKVTITAGEEFGTSDFDFEFDAVERFGGYITGDNYGSRLTGKQRLSIAFDVNSPFGLGDKVSFGGVQSKGADLQDGRVSYIFPVFSNGIKGEISAEKTDYELGQEYKDLEAVGTAKVLSFALSYPVIRTQFENLYAKAGYAKKEMKDNIKVLGNTIPKEIDVTSFSLSYERYTTLFGLNTFYTVGTNMNFGSLKITDEKEKELNKKGINTLGSYAKADISLLGSIALSDVLTLSGNLKIQKALNNKNLDGSEQISLSGTSGVGAYPDSEYSADNGYVIGAELSYKLPEFVGITHNAGVFFDIGRGIAEENSPASAKNRMLADIGLSYHIRYKGFFAKLQAAKVVGSEEVLSEDDYETRYLCQIGAIF